MRIKLNSIVTGIILLALISCAKKADKYIAVNKDMAVLHQNWKIGEANLKDNIATFKDDLKKFGVLQQDLSRLVDSKKAETQKEIKPLLEQSKLRLDSLKEEVNNLNIYLQEWKSNSKSVNELVLLLQEMDISPEEATIRITQLREFKAKADPKLELIRQKVEAHRIENKKVDLLLDKYRKKKKTTLN